MKLRFPFSPLSTKPAHIVPGDPRPLRAARRAVGLCFFTFALLGSLHAEDAAKGGPAAEKEPDIRLQGAPVISHVMIATAPIMAEQGIAMKVESEVGSGAAAYALGEEATDMALMTRPLTAEERAAYPGKAFVESQIGSHAVALLVPRAVWESGVRALTREQVAEIYEGRIRNWKEVGGDDRPIKFFNAEKGRGVWEIYAQWLYGEIRKAPLGKFEIVVDGEDARNTVQFNSGALSMAPLQWVDRKEVFALGIKEKDGTVIEPSIANIADGTYPLAKPVMVVTVGRPVGARKRIIDFLLSPEGVEIVRKSEIIPVSELKAKQP